MSLTLKMRCNEVQATDGDSPQESVSLMAVVGTTGDNASWSKWTPSGNLRFTVTNPDALGQIEPGAEYLVTIVPA